MKSMFYRLMVEWQLKNSFVRNIGRGTVEAVLLSYYSFKILRSDYLDN